MKPINIERLLEQIPTPEKVEQQIEESREQRRVLLPGPTSTVQIRDFDEDYLVFENIKCYDADGRVTEQYPSLRVRKQVYHYNKGGIIYRRPYQAIIHAEKQGDFNPCSALTTALLVAAFRGQEKSYANDFLEQYRNKDNGDGYHALNTITWQRDTGHLIHYPQHADFPRGSRGMKQINQARQRRVVDFTVDNSFGDRLVSDVPPMSEFEKYLKNLYGLPDLGIVVEIGNRFSKPAKVWFLYNPATANYTSGAWLGSGSNSNCFNCDSYLNLNYASAFRGVR